MRHVANAVSVTRSIALLALLVFADETAAEAALQRDAGATAGLDLAGTSVTSSASTTASAQPQQALHLLRACDGGGEWLTLSGAALLIVRVVLFGAFFLALVAEAELQRTSSHVRHLRKMRMLQRGDPEAARADPRCAPDDEPNGSSVWLTTAR